MNPLDAIYEEAGRRFNVNPALLKAQNAEEVGPHGGATTAGDSNHIGYGQLSPLMRQKYGVSDPTNPGQAIMAQAAQMRHLLDKHNNDPAAALTEYTGGPNSAHWGPHTQGYAPKILASFGNASPDYEGARSPQTDDFFADVYNPQRATAPSAAKNAPAVSGSANPGSFISSLANGATLGAGPPISGATVAAKAFVQRLMGGSSLGEAAKWLGPDYEFGKRSFEQGSAQYAGQHPLADLAGSVVGSTPPTMAALAAGQSYAAEPLLAKLGALGPQAAKAAAFLGGDFARGSALESAGGSGVKNWLVRRAANAIGGAGTGLAAAGIQAGESDRPLGEQLARGAEFGGAVGPAAGSVLEPLMSHINPTIAAAAQKLQDLGVPLRPGQIPGSSWALQGLQRVFGDGGAEARAGLTNAAAKTIGLPGGPLTRATMNGAEDSLQRQFQNFAQRPEVITGEQLPLLHQDIQDIWRSATRDPIPSDSLDKLDSTMGLIYKAAQQGKGAISGNDYLEAHAERLDAG